MSIAVVNWLPIFSNPTFANIVFKSLKFSQSEKNLKIFAYVLMENHLHLIAAHDDLVDVMRTFKSFTARQIINEMKEKNLGFWLDQLKYHKKKWKHDQEFQLWQEGSHPKQVQSSEMMLQKIEYIHMNPVKRGYIEKPEHWLYSSARNYAGLEARLEIEEW